MQGQMERKIQSQSETFRPVLANACVEWLNEALCTAKRTAAVGGPTCGIRAVIAEITRVIDGQEKTGGG